VATLPAVPEDPSRIMRELLATGQFLATLELFERLHGDPSSRLGDIQLLGATAATRLGKFGLAEALASSALARFDARTDSDGRMRALNLLGAIAFAMGRLDEADRNFRGAQDLAQHLGDRLMAARTANNMASVAHLRGEPEIALGLYRTALLAYQQLGDRRGAAEVYHNLALAYRQMTHWKEAEHMSDEAVRHAELVGEHGLLGLTIVGRVELDIERGEVDVAAQSLERAARHARASAQAVSEADVGRLRARVSRLRGDYSTALREGRDARRLAQTVGNAILLADCEAELALALRGLGRVGEAEAHRSIAQSGYDALGAAVLRTRFDQEWELLTRN
jgi:tetratricopeptide (TPR) repeat protein